MVYMAQLDFLLIGQSLVPRKAAVQSGVETPGTGLWLLVTQQPLASLLCRIFSQLCFLP